MPHPVIVKHSIPICHILTLIFLIALALLVFLLIFVSDFKIFSLACVVDFSWINM